MIHGGADRTEDTERAPDEQDAAADAEANRVLAERVELPDDEIELAGKVSENEQQDFLTRDVIGSHAAEYRDGDQRERKQRQQRVVGNRRRVGQVVGLIHLNDRPPGRQAGNAPGFEQLSNDVARSPKALTLILVARA